MKENTCCFTGHRRIAKDNIDALKRYLKNEISALVEEKGITEFIAGGALGFDTLAAMAVLGLKEKYPHITLRLILPCPEQDKLWNDRDKALYRDILKAADLVEYVYDSYCDGCMLERNRVMADSSSVCIAYYDGRARSGTAMTVSYAKKNGLQVINLY